MKSRYLLAGAGLLQTARAIPAYITTVYSCPDVVTITQTVYPPGWTNTGPIYTTRPLTEPRPDSPPPPQGTPQAQCTEQGLTTSWETEYATRTVYYSEYGMYEGPPGCPPTIIAYMPTTVTCSEPQTTGWVGYAADISCASCTATTLVGLRPGYTTVNGAVNTYYTVWTEVYVEAGTTTQANMVGAQWTATGTAPYAAPYPKQCTSTYRGNGGGYATPTNGGGYTATRGGGGYPSIDYNNPSVFRGGESVPIQSNGYTPATQPGPQPTYTSYNGGSRRPYPSIDYGDPNNFRPGPGVGSTRAPANNGGTTYTRPPSAETATSAAPGGSRRPYPSMDFNNPNNFRPSGEPSVTYNGAGSTRPPSAETAATTAAPQGTATRPRGGESGRPTSYPGDFSDTNVFRPLSGTIEIVSYTGPAPTIPPSGQGYVLPTNHGDNYNSIDFSASENFRAPTSRISIVSLNPPQTFPPGTVTIRITSRPNSYPSIDYANPTVFAAVDPNAAPASTAASAASSATSAA